MRAQWANLGTSQDGGHIHLPDGECPHGGCQGKARGQGGLQDRVCSAGSSRLSPGSRGGRGWQMVPPHCVLAQPSLCACVPASSCEGTGLGSGLPETSFLLGHPS